MLELLFGCFLLGSLYRAFREGREPEATPLERIRRDTFHDAFDQSVYEPSPSKPSLQLAEGQYVLEEDSVVFSMENLSSDSPTINSETKLLNLV